MLTLTKCLSAETVDQLKCRLKALPYTGNKNLKKQELVLLIEQLITNRLQSVWDSLDDICQKVVAEVVHGPLDTFDERQFFAKYKTKPKTFKESSWSRKEYSLLESLFFSNYMPQDLQEQFRSFVKRPAEPDLLGVKEVNAHPQMQFMSMELAALQEIKTLLRLIDNDSLKVSEKTQQPSSAALRQVETILCGGDFYSTENQLPVAQYEQEIGFIRSYAWLMLIQAGKLAKGSAGKLCLTPKGKKAIHQSPEVVLKNLWETWLNSKLLDEFRRINVIKGQTGKKGKRYFTPAQSRRSVIVEALIHAPLNDWISFDQFSRHMLSNNITFEVTNNEPWHLYICEPEYGSLGYDSCHNWGILQERYMLCFLFEYVATLGLIDVAYISPRNARTEFRHQWGTDDLSFLSRYDGLQYFRLNNLGAYCLGIITEFKSTHNASDKLDITVNQAGEVKIQTKPIPPEIILILKQFAKQKTPTDWVLDKGLMLDALQSGHQLTDLSDLFTQHQVDLPANIESLIKQLAYNANQLRKKESTLLFECSSSELAHHFMSHPTTQAYCLLAGEHFLVVPESQLLKFQKAMKKLDYPIII